MVNRHQQSGPRTRRECRCPRARHQHGTRGAYRADHCRCLPCRLAASRDRQEHRTGTHALRPRSLPLIGVQRRLTALYALGWSWAALARELDVSKENVYATVAGRHRRGCSPAYHAQICALYDRLSLIRPEGVAADRARKRARLRSYLPPLAFDDDSIDEPMSPGPRAAVVVTGYGHAFDDTVIDEIAVERAMRGDPVPLTKAEKSEAHARLNDMGLSARMIADRLGTTSRTVTRRRARAA